MSSDNTNEEFTLCDDCKNPHSHLSRSPQNGQTHVQFSMGFLQSSQIVKSSLVLSEFIIFLIVQML